MKSQYKDILTLATQVSKLTNLNINEVKELPLSEFQEYIDILQDNPPIEYILDIHLSSLQNIILSLFGSKKNKYTDFMLHKQFKTNTIEDEDKELMNSLMNFK